MSAPRGRQPLLTDCGLPGVRDIPFGALAAGFNGLRITGNMTFLRPEDWPLFMEYEALVDRAFLGRRIVTLCTYRLGDCGASEVLDVMRRHSCTLDHPDQGWQIITGNAR